MGAWCYMKYITGSERLRISVGSAGDHDTKLVSIRIGEYDPTDVALAGSSHEVAAELERTFGNVVGIVGVKIDVAPSWSTILCLTTLKCEIGAAARGVAQPEQLAMKHSGLVSGQLRPELAEPFWVDRIKDDIAGSEDWHQLVSGAFPGYCLVVAEVKAHHSSISTVPERPGLSRAKRPFLCRRPHSVNDTAQADRGHSSACGRSPRRTCPASSDSFAI